MAADLKPRWEPWRGVFSTLRVVNGKALFATEHERLLRHAASVLGLEYNHDFLAEAAQLPQQSGRMRWVVTKTWAESFFGEEDFVETEPAKLVISAYRVGSQNWDARFKTLSYLSHIQARDEAQPADALLLNERGEVASAATANVFWVKDHQVFTPAHEVGCREGITRAFVMKHLSVSAVEWPVDMLFHADEIFLSSSMRGIVPVTHFEYNTLAVGPITSRMQIAYQEEITRQTAG